MLGRWSVPGERRRHHRGRHCGCKGRDLLALDSVSHGWYVGEWYEVLHRLKLVTGVDISTRPVRRLGREGKVKKSKSLRRAAEVKRMAFRRSKTILFDGLIMLYARSHLFHLDLLVARQATDRLGANLPHDLRYFTISPIPTSTYLILLRKMILILRSLTSFLISSSTADFMQHL